MQTSTCSTAKVVRVDEKVIAREYVNEAASVPAALAACAAEEGDLGGCEVWRLLGYTVVRLYGCEVVRL